MTTIPKIGDRLRSIFTGRHYRVETFTELFAVLKGEDPFNNVYTEIGNLASFYEQVEVKRDRYDLPLASTREVKEWIQESPIESNVQAERSAVREEDSHAYPIKMDPFGH